MSAGITCAGVVIGECELQLISKTAVNVFEILEKYWSQMNCSLIDMKIEFGVDAETSQYY